MAVDGTRVKANASKNRAMSYGRMKEEERRLQGRRQPLVRRDRGYRPGRGRAVWRLERLVASAGAGRHREAPEVDPRVHGKARGAEEGRGRSEAGPGGDEIPVPPPRRPKKPRPPEEQTRLEFPETWSEKPKSVSAKTKSRIEPKDKDQIIFTDPDLRIMLNSDKAFIQGYNAQAAVGGETHIIVAVDLMGQAADSPHLKAMVRQVETNTARRPAELSADAGYHSEANLRVLEEMGIEAFILQLLMRGSRLPLNSP